MNLTLLRVGFRHGASLSPPCPGALLQGTCPKDCKEVSKGAGARLVLEHAAVAALGPNECLRACKGFFFLVFSSLVLLPEREEGLCHHLSVGTKGLVYSGSVSLHLPGLGWTTESFITPSLHVPLPEAG